MRKLIAISVALSAAMAAHALPVYDNFSSYGPPGAWTETGSAPLTSYASSGAPQLGGSTAPSGEPWAVYTNYGGSLGGNVAPQGNSAYANQNVSVVNYFGAGQAGSSDTMVAAIPPGFPAPGIGGANDTGTNSIWTPGWWYGTGSGSTSYTGGVGACLEFASDYSGTSGNKIYASFFVDIPDCSTAFGSGQSLDHGYSAGFIEAGELPSPNSSLNQNVVPGLSTSPYNVTPFAKFNTREVNSSTWRPGVGFLDSNGNSDNSLACTQHTIHFIVMSYEFNGGYASTGQDAIRIWGDPSASTFGSPTAPGASATSSPTEGSTFSLSDVGGFFFLANAQDSGALPNSGIIFNSLHVGTTWAYVTGGAQFVTNEPYAVASTGQSLVLNPTAVAGGVSLYYSWANSSGPLTLGSHYSVNPTTGALTIANVQASDADTYTLSASTSVTSQNGVSPATTQTLVVVFTSESASAISSGQFTLNFTGPVGANYRIWSTTSLNNTAPVLSSWNYVTSGTFASGINTYTDTAAPSQANYYTITVP